MLLSVLAGALVALVALAAAEPAVSNVRYISLLNSTSIPTDNYYKNNTVRCDSVITGQSSVQFDVRDLDSTPVDVAICTSDTPNTGSDTCYRISTNQVLTSPEFVDICYQSYIPLGVPEGVYYVVLLRASDIVASSSDPLVVPQQLYLDNFVEPVTAGRTRHLEFRTAHSAAGSGNGLPQNMTWLLVSDDGVPVNYQKPTETKSKVRVHFPKTLNTGVYRIFFRAYNSTTTYSSVVPVVVSRNRVIYWATLIAIAVGLFLILLLTLLMALFGV